MFEKLCAYYNLKYIIVKNANNHLSLQQIVIFLLVKGVALMLMAAD